MRKVFTTGQVAKICHVAPRTVSKWFDSGRLKGYRIPGSQDRRIPRENLIRFLTDSNMPLDELDEGFRVLVLTDNGLPETLKKLLPEEEDFHFAQATDAFEAGMMLVGFRPQVVIFDLNGGSSLVRSEAVTAVQRIRKTDGFAKAQILAICADDEADPSGLKASGFSDCFSSPFDPALLAERLQKAAKNGK